MTSASASSGSSGTLRERFHAAASYLGFEGSSNSIAISPEFPWGVSSPISKFPDDVAFLLYSSYHQATIGPCKIPKPTSDNHTELIKWSNWKQLQNMLPSDAKRLFVKLLEEEDPGWSSRVSSSPQELVADVEIINNAKMEPITEIGDSFPVPKSILAKNCWLSETQCSAAISEGFLGLTVYEVMETNEKSKDLADALKEERALPLELIRRPILSKNVVNKTKEQSKCLAASLEKERLPPSQLRQLLADAEARHAEVQAHHAEVDKELQSLREKYGAKESKCAELELIVRELQQKLLDREQEQPLQQQTLGAGNQSAGQVRQLQHTEIVEHERP